VQVFLLGYLTAQSILFKYLLSGYYISFSSPKAMMFSGFLPCPPSAAHQANARRAESLKKYPVNPACPVKSVFYI